MMTLTDAIKHCEDVANDRCGCAEDCVSEHRQLADWLKELQRYQWIPVEERLPHDGEKILACYDDGWMRAGEFHAWASFSFIAWMPLPKPYGEREGE